MPYLGILDRAKYSEALCCSSASADLMLESAVKISYRKQINGEILQSDLNRNHYLDVAFNFREQVDKLDVSREEEGPGGDTAQVILGVEKAELNSRTTPGISGYEVTKLSHDVASHLHHVLMHCLGLQSLNKTLSDYHSLLILCKSVVNNLTSKTVLAA